MVVLLHPLEEEKNIYIFSFRYIYIAIRMSKSLYNHLGMMNRFLIGFLLPSPCCAHFYFYLKRNYIVTVDCNIQTKLQNCALKVADDRSAS